MILNQFSLDLSVLCEGLGLQASSACHEVDSGAELGRSQSKHCPLPFTQVRQEEWSAICSMLCFLPSFQVVMHLTVIWKAPGRWSGITHNPQSTLMGPLGFKGQGHGHSCGRHGGVRWPWATALTMLEVLREGLRGPCCPPSPDHRQQVLWHFLDKDRFLRECCHFLPLYHVWVLVLERTLVSWSNFLNGCNFYNSTLVPKKGKYNH
jgi:hypothetical protein